MSKIYIGSARHDEHGSCYTGGKDGDQLQVSTPDYDGEVSMQEMYTHSKGWYILRPKSIVYADALAERMIAACNNPHIGYDQNDRNGVVKNGIDTKTDTDSDCSSLMRECVKEATGTDPGDFTTANEVSALMATGLFDNMGAYVSQSSTPVYNGDILVTQSKGHTVMVVQGSARSVTGYTEGWVQEADGRWWYRYSDGSWPASCWKKIAEGANAKNVHWYYFGSSGYMKTGLQTINGELYALAPDGALEGACMITDSNGALSVWYVD